MATTTTTKTIVIKTVNKPPQKITVTKKVTTPTIKQGWTRPPGR